MNQKELGELRRRFRPEKCAISRIYGCYVNTNREMISYVDAPLGTLSQEEGEQFLALLKKSLSGTLGKNLIDIVFTTQQVADSDEHRLLSALRESALKNGDVREEFYRKVIDALDMGDSNYLILLAHDAYDVPGRGKDGETMEDGSDTVFSYIVCCVCPVKDGKVELGYFSGENEFHASAPSQVVAPPELGFLFPAFDDRAANIYNALFYSKKADQIHQEFIDAVFHTEAPMSASEQKEAFRSALSGALSEGCGFQVAQAVHEQLRERIEQHKDSKAEEPLVITPKEVGSILAGCGVAEEQVAAFEENCGENFGAGAVLSPQNLIDSGRFQIVTQDVTITVAPERSYLVEARIIDGQKYILIPADETTEVNGLPVDIK